MVPRRRRLRRAGHAGAGTCAATQQASSEPIRWPSTSTSGPRYPMTLASSWFATATASRQAFASHLRVPDAARQRAVSPPARSWPCDFGPDLVARLSRAEDLVHPQGLWHERNRRGHLSAAAHWRAISPRRIRGSNELELLAPVELNIVCFGYRSAQPDSINARIVADLQESGIVAPSTTTIGGRLAIRAALVNHRTCRDEVDDLIEAVLSFGRQAVNQND